VRPGAVLFLFPPGESATSLVDRLRTAGWRGQIVGGHGTGKSTLLAALLPELRRAGRQPVVVTLHDGRRTVPPDAWSALRQARRSGQALLVVVDGYERLTPWHRLRLRWHCWVGRHGLLVTAHIGVGLPDLFRTQVTGELADRVLDHLLNGAQRLVCSAELAERLALHQGNLRQALFDLYDLHEMRSRSLPSDGGARYDQGRPAGGP
jgi:hypothetical protein